MDRWVKWVKADYKKFILSTKKLSGLVINNNFEDNLEKKSWQCNLTHWLLSKNKEKFKRQLKNELKKNELKNEFKLSYFRLYYSNYFIWNKILTKQRIKSL